MFRWLVVLGTVVCCFVTLGCGGPAQEFKYELVVIPKGLTHEHWQSVHRGAERAAADLKEKGIPVKIFWQGPHRENDADEQRRIVDQFISRRVSGIVLAPQHSGTMIPPVERAVREKIPCVIIDSGLGREDLYIQYIATDNYNGGKMAGPISSRASGQGPTNLPAQNRDDALSGRFRKHRTTRKRLRRRYRCTHRRAEKSGRTPRSPGCRAINTPVPPSIPLSDRPAL
ncbi:MAG: hypothetical protein KatS3mg105_2129 [Gemmatales bacterium]|nr:MAG: hypothetical protein KatS3mg105_2129 [Gemmatales bacterium]